MKDNWIYSNTDDNKARFVLGEKGKKTLICMGINPSTAIPEKLDPTLKVVKRFAKDLGYGSWIMLNIYPQRSTEPSGLDLEKNSLYHKKNLDEIESLLKTGNFDLWAAWGTNIKKRKYLIQCLKGIVEITKKHSIKWYTIGRKTKEGHPHHPLYLKRGLDLEIFDIEEYLKKLG